jgi:hypothetical protein
MVADSMRGWLLRVESFLERAEVALGRLSLASVVVPNPSLSPPRAEPDGDHTVERVAELYGPLSPRAKATSSVASACDPNSMVVTPVLKIMPELQNMCDGLVSSPSSENLMVDSLVPSTMAWESNTPLESSLVATLEESDAPDIAAVQSNESTVQVVHADADVAVVGVPKPNLGITFAIKFYEFLSKLDSEKSKKTIGCLLKEKGLWTKKGSRDKYKKDGTRRQSGIRKKKSSKCKGTKGDVYGEALMVP